MAARPTTRRTIRRPRQILKPPNGDQIYREILDLLQAHPELVTQLTVNANNYQLLLATIGADGLGLSDGTQTMMDYVSSPPDGPAVVQFSHNSGYMCGKGTFMLSCLRGTAQPTQV